MDVRLEQQLSRLAAELRRLRAELSVTEEQLNFLRNEADDANLRSLVSETPLAEAEARDAQRHADRLEKYRVDLLSKIQAVENEQNSLLDQLGEDTAEDR